MLGGKTGYNDDARYCLVVGTKIEERIYYMAFLSNKGKMTRFGDVARVADYVLAHPPKSGKPDLVAKADDTKSESGAPSGVAAVPAPLPVGVAAPRPSRCSPPLRADGPGGPGATAAATASPTTSP